jgi:uncharacterized protein
LVKDLPRFIKSTRKKIDYLQQAFPIAITSEQVSGIKTLMEFDEKITAPLNGFDDGQDYYRKSSGNQFLKLCTTDTLIIHAKDDPFMTDKVIPTPGMLSEHVTLELSAHGGHVGFLSGNNPLNPEFWTETRVVKFIEDKLVSRS